MLSKDELERERYLDRLKGQRDAESLANAARFEREAGHEAGREEGRKEQIIARIRFVQRMLKQPVTPDEEFAELAADTLAELADKLEAEVLSKTNGTANSSS
jgi:flagellar biosynthesis/type III secretory pathway protein FliH